jgi:hypothetical protein
MINGRPFQPKLKVTLLTRSAALALVLSAAPLLSGCTSLFAYEVAQEVQRNQCAEMRDPELRARCYQSARVSKEEYDRMRDKSKAR